LFKIIKISVYLLIIVFLYGLVPKAQAKNDSLFIFVEYAAKTGKCTQSSNDQVNIYTIGKWKLKSGMTDYKITYSSKPKNLSGENIRIAVEKSFQTIQGANNGELFRYAGESKELKPTKDGQNSIFWLPLRGGVVATTYIWTENSRVVDADIIFNRRYVWSNTEYNGSNDCGGSAKTYDIRNIATHEIGHWIGLVDNYNSQAKDQTMYGFASLSELKKVTLGVGDINGIKSNWP